MLSGAIQTHQFGTVANNVFRAYSIPATLHVRLSFISKGISNRTFSDYFEMSDKHFPVTLPASLGELTFDSKNCCTVPRCLKLVNCFGFLPVLPTEG